MRQVPEYLIIGNGRVAKHFRHYFSLLNLPFLAWHRQESQEKLQESQKLATHILLLIKDDHIPAFVSQHLSASNATIIHFSGSLVTDLAYGAHPLMTFGHDLYSLEKYQAIPFIIDDDAPAFENLLPGLSNKHARLEKTLKPKYHALSVMSGNFSCLLWQKFLMTLQQEFNLSPEFAYPYLLQQAENLTQDFKSALTGPLVRDDVATIEKNIAALESDPFQALYKNFVLCFQQMKEENIS